VDQYEKFTVPGPDEDSEPLHVNGRLTLGENIADAGGLSAAYYAWKKRDDANSDPQMPGLDGFSKEQLFFVSYASWWCGKTTKEAAINAIYNDPHAPKPARIMVCTLFHLSFVMDSSFCWYIRLGREPWPILVSSVKLSAVLRKSPLVSYGNKVRTKNDICVLLSIMDVLRKERFYFVGIMNNRGYIVTLFLGFWLDLLIFLSLYNTKIQAGQSGASNFRFLAFIWWDVCLFVTYRKQKGMLFSLISY
jgi:hypothetical protein